MASDGVVIVCNVHLPQAACEAASASGLVFAHSDPPLFHLQYRRKRTELFVYAAASSAKATPAADYSRPFQSICPRSTETAESAQCPSVDSQEWKRVAHFDNLPAADSEPSDALVQAGGSLAVPGGLCHPHLHLDKCYLLDRCKISSGTFDEAMTETSRAKAKFQQEDLLERGRRLICASISHGVTAMRAHVEVDPAVQLLCAETGTALKAEFRSACDVQLVAFAQDPLFYPDDAAKQQSMSMLLHKAASMPDIDAVGSAPYVESSADGPAEYVERQRRNICTIFDLAADHGKDVDLHLDYDLDPRSESLLPYVVELTAARTWQVRGRARRITIGHCTKLSTLPREQFAQIQSAIKAIPRGEGEVSPVSFVALPPSDVYMQGRGQPWNSRSRATLPLLDLANHLDAHCALGVNNVGNLFTPQGDADPLALLPWATALYQDATQPMRLLDFVSSQARYAAGVDTGYPALWQDLTILDTADSVQNAVLAPPFGRVTVKAGRLVSQRSISSHISLTRPPTA